MSGKGKLIAIEGGDGSGKTVQTELLVKTLQSMGVVTRFEFPQYGQNVYANLLDKLLHGKKDADQQTFNFLALDPYVACCLYALDRVIAKDSILKALERGTVVCNRYTPSNIAHQCAKIPEEEWADLIAFIENGEYKELGIPPPDLTLYLSVSAFISQGLIQREKDQHEENIPYQERVRRIYQKISEERDNWILVECTDGVGALLPPEVIHQKVMAFVRSVFS